MSLLRFDPEDFKVISGTDSLKKPRYTNEVCELNVHDKFNFNKPSIYDVGILKLCTPFEFNQFASPAHLLNEDALLNFNVSTVFISGFGKSAVS